MTRADSGAVVAMKVFVKQHQVAPVRIVAIERVRAMHGTAALLVAQEDLGEAPREFPGDFPQRFVFARAGGELDSIVLAEIVMKLLQGLDQEKIDGEPDRSA